MSAPGWKESIECRYAPRWTVGTLNPACIYHDEEWKFSTKQPKLAKEIVALLNRGELFQEHTDAVAQFLNELYAIMVDPLADGVRTVADTMEALRAAALKSREQAAMSDKPVEKTPQEIAREVECIEDFLSMMRLVNFSDLEGPELRGVGKTTSISGP